MLITGCTKQHLIIDSNPTGAQAEVNGKNVGKTPVSLIYVETGQFRIRLQKNGYEIIDTKFKVKKRWFNYPIIDFFAEAIPIIWSSKKHVNFKFKTKKIQSHKKLRKKSNSILHID